MTLPLTLNNFTAIIDGIGYAGRIREGRPPVVAMVTEQVSLGGMAAPIEVDMGLVESMFCEMTFVEFTTDLFKHLAKPDLMWVLRGAASNNQQTRSIVYRMRGVARVLDPGVWNRERMASLTLRINVNYLQIMADDVELVEIDAAGMIRKIDGRDTLAEQRRKLGIGQA